MRDCLTLLVYKERGEKSKGQRERNQATLRDICGLEALQGFDGVNYALSLLCLSQSVMLGFDNKASLLAWDARIRYSLGEVHRFNVNVQPGTKLESGPASLHLCNNLLVIARDLPPTVIGQWKLSDLRRYGAVPNGFVFEGGTRCGYYYHILFSEENPMMIKLNAWLVLVQSRLGLSDIPCGESSTEVFANSKCENQIT
ncbi:Dok-7 isoform X2 [Labeo rohita]|uniref:Dok-7 isoform X2 n=1 Tax=Labeo rohita TaxID=84645 RepID=A0A498NXR6_LABRO|nr:Dok-7 isoform X2 [Labeo rohita]